jgi:hypothetical protein
MNGVSSRSAAPDGNRVGFFSSPAAAICAASIMHASLRLKSATEVDVYTPGHSYAQFLSCGRPLMRYTAGVWFGCRR